MNGHARIDANGGREEARVTDHEPVGVVEVAEVVSVGAGAGPPSAAAVWLLVAQAPMAGIRSEQVNRMQWCRSLMGVS